MGKHECFVKGVKTDNVCYHALSNYWFIKLKSYYPYQNEIFYCPYCGEKLEVDDE